MIRWIKNLVRRKKPEDTPDKELIEEVKRRQRLVEIELRQLEIRRGNR